MRTACSQEVCRSLVTHSCLTECSRHMVNVSLQDLYGFFISDCGSANLAALCAMDCMLPPALRAYPVVRPPGAAAALAEGTHSQRGQLTPGAAPAVHASTVRPSDQPTACMMQRSMMWVPQ